MRPYHSINIDGVEFVLQYKVNKNIWAGVQKNQNDRTDTPDNIVQSLNISKYENLQPTYIFDGEMIKEPIYFIYWDGVLQVVDDMNMLKQINEYYWTTGFFFCHYGMVRWNIADRIWEIDGVRHKMHVMTPRGQWFS